MIEAQSEDGLMGLKRGHEDSIQRDFEDQYKISIANRAFTHLDQRGYL